MTIPDALRDLADRLAHADTGERFPKQLTAEAVGTLVAAAHECEKLEKERDEAREVHAEEVLRCANAEILLGRLVEAFLAYQKALEPVFTDARRALGERG